MGLLRPIGHQDRLSVVDHLDELRDRLIWSLAVFIALFALCYWQNDLVLEIAGEPLEQSQREGKGNDPLEQTARFDAALGETLSSLAPALEATKDTLRALADEPGVSAATRAEADAAAQRLDAASQEVRAAGDEVPENEGRRPVTLGVAEPFVTTFTVAGYTALLLSLPFLLWQAYAFVLPAFSPRERRAAVPLMVLVPVLFAAGVAFGYFVALPRAVDFLQNFNDDAFDILIQARDYYRFVIYFLAVMGLVFQVPVGVLALTRSGVVTARVLWERQGYVILGIAVLAAVATPTPDPVTMLVTMFPLVLLYWLSIGLAWVFRPRGPTARSRWEDWWEEDGEPPPEDAGGQGAAAREETGAATPLS